MADQLTIPAYEDFISQVQSAGQDVNAAREVYFEAYIKPQFADKDVAAARSSFDTHFAAPDTSGPSTWDNVKGVAEEGYKGVRRGLNTVQQGALGIASGIAHNYLPDAAGEYMDRQVRENAGEIRSLAPSVTRQTALDSPTNTAKYVAGAVGEMAGNIAPNLIMGPLTRGMSLIPSVAATTFGNAQSEALTRQDIKQATEQLDSWNKNVGASIPKEGLPVDLSESYKGIDKTQLAVGAGLSTGLELAGLRFMPSAIRNKLEGKEAVDLLNDAVGGVVSRTLKAGGKAAFGEGLTEGLQTYPEKLAEGAGLSEVFSPQTFEEAKDAAASAAVGSFGIGAAGAQFGGSPRQNDTQFSNGIQSEGMTQEDEIAAMRGEVAPKAPPPKSPEALQAEEAAARAAQKDAETAKVQAVQDLVPNAFVPPKPKKGELPDLERMLTYPEFEKEAKKSWQESVPKVDPLQMNQAYTEALKENPSLDYKVFEKAQKAQMQRAHAAERPEPKTEMLRPAYLQYVQMHQAGIRGFNEAYDKLEKELGPRAPDVPPEMVGASSSLIGQVPKGQTDLFGAPTGADMTIPAAPEPMMSAEDTQTRGVQLQLPMDQLRLPAPQSEKLLDLAAKMERGDFGPVHPNAVDALLKAAVEDQDQAQQLNTANAPKEPAPAPNLPEMPPAIKPALPLSTLPGANNGLQNQGQTPTGQEVNSFSTQSGAINGQSTTAPQGLQGREGDPGATPAARQGGDGGIQNPGQAKAQVKTKPKNRREVDPETDDLIVAIRKLGGLNVDPGTTGNDFAGRLKSIKTPTIVTVGDVERTKGAGRSLDDLAQALWERGYLDAHDAGELYDKLWRAEGGTKFWSREKQTADEAPVDTGTDRWIERIDQAGTEDEVAAIMREAGNDTVFQSRFRNDANFQKAWYDALDNAQTQTAPAPKEQVGWFAPVQNAGSPEQALAALEQVRQKLDENTTLTPKVAAQRYTMLDKVEEDLRKKLAAAPTQDLMPAATATDQKTADQLALEARQQETQRKLNATNAPQGGGLFDMDNRQGEMDLSPAEPVPAADPRDREFTTITRLKGVQDKGDGVFYIPENLMTPQRRNKLMDEVEKAKPYISTRVNPTARYEFKDWAQVTGNPTDRGYAILDRRVRQAERQNSGDPNATSRSQGADGAVSGTQAGIVTTAGEEQPATGRASGNRGGLDRTRADRPAESTAVTETAGGMGEPGAVGQEALAAQAPSVEERTSRYTDTVEETKDAPFRRQLDLFLDADPAEVGQPGAKAEAAKRAAVAAVTSLRGSTGGVLGPRLADSYAARQRVSLVGHTLTSREDLATLAQVYRDPRFETFRLFFTNQEGKIVSQVGLSSRLPTSSAIIIGTDAKQYLTDLARAAGKSGATSYYMLHNHPSTNPMPSDADISLTKLFDRELNLISNGHVILDTNQFGVIKPSGDVEIIKKDFGQVSPYKANEFSDITINSPLRLIDVAKKLEVDQDAVTLVVTTAGHKVLGITTVPADTINKGNRSTLTLRVRKLLRTMNGARVFAVGTDIGTLRPLGDLVMDAIHVTESGEYASINERTGGSYGMSDPFVVKGRRVPRVTADTSPEFNYLRDQAAVARKGMGSGPQVAEGEGTYAAQKAKAWSEDVLGAAMDTKTEGLEAFKLLLNPHQVADLNPQYPSAAIYADAVDAMQAAAGEYQQRIGVLTERMENLPKEELGALSDLMTKSTLTDIHVDKPFDDAANAHLDPEKNDDKLHAQLAERYQALTPEAQAIYSEMRDHFADMWERRFTAVQDLATRMGVEGQAATKLKSEINQLRRKVKGPYFPLMREGRYVVTWKSQALLDAEKAKDMPLVDQLKGSAADYWVRFTDSESEAKKLSSNRPEKMGEDANGAFKLRTEASREVSGAGAEFVAKLETTLRDRIPDKETGDVAVTALKQVFLETLPDLSVMKRTMMRRGVAGVRSEDMVRAIAKAGVADAHYLARLAHADKITSALQNLRLEDANPKPGEEVDTTEPGTPRGGIGRVYNLIAKDYRGTMLRPANGLGNKIASKLVEVSYLHSLALDTGNLIANAMQPTLTVWPMLGGRHGFQRSYLEMARGLQDALKIVRAVNYNLDIEKITNENGEQDALKKLRDMGKIELSMSRDLASAGRGESLRYDRMRKFLAAPAHYVETVTRISSVLAAYRMELARARRDEQGTSEESRRMKAIDYAARISREALVDFTPGGAPIMMKGNQQAIAKVAMQYKRFAISMLYLYGKTARDAFKASDMGSKKEAQKTLAAMLFTQFTIAGGLAGLPTALPAQLLASLWPTDDEDESAEEKLNRLADTLAGGDPQLSMAMRKGPLSALTGADLSRKMGLSDLLVLNSGQITEPLKPNEKPSTRIIKVAAPSLAFVDRMYDGMTAASNGDLVDAAVKFLPRSIISDVILARRAAEEGMTSKDRTGKVSPLEYQANEIIAKAMGIPPLLETLKWEASDAATARDKGKADRRERLLDQWVIAARKDDAEGKAKAQADIDEYNASLPEGFKGYKIKKGDQFSRKQSARKGEKSLTETGIKKTKRNKGWVGELDMYKPLR